MKKILLSAVLYLAKPEINSLSFDVLCYCFAVLQNLRFVRVNLIINISAIQQCRIIHKITVFVAAAFTCTQF